MIAANDALRDPRARANRHLLQRAGHRVSLITAGPDDGQPDVVSIRASRRNLFSRISRRLGISRSDGGTLTRSLAAAAAATGGNLFVPTDRRAIDAALEAATAAGGYVFRTPKMPDLGELDLINVAPARPDVAAPVAGVGKYHTPDDERAPYTPGAGAHQGRRVVLCYRRSEINPGRYLEAALRRAGAELRVEVEGIDLSSVDPATDFVIFVEGPYPALDVEGDTSVPVLFWAHHGEHHLHANLRLADRYRADAVLLAHSWHLAFWFPTPVHRFPFGLADDLLDPRRPLRDRSFDVAMVGAGLRRGGQYGRRQQLVEALEQALPHDRLGFRENVSADEMAALYADARIVINEGGTRHYPITMRVLETVGSGSVLLSDPLPGMSMLLEKDKQYLELSDDVVSDVQAVIADLDKAQEMVDSALETARGRHTYAHRVDELFAIAAATPKRPIPSQPARSPLARVIDNDVQTQRVAHWNAPELVGELPSREVWNAPELEPARLAPGKMEAVALRTDDISDHRPLLRSARRFIYIDGHADLTSYLAEERPDAVVSRIEGVQRVDTMAPSYRIMDFESTTP